MELGGLHHLTAVTTDAGQNVDFYTRVLGMRLVKKTVNQDDVSAYHLFYADALGSPGTDITFFDWPHLKVAPNRPGAGEVSVTGLRVPDREALQWWSGRLEDSGVAHGGIQDGDGRLYLDFQDPEGQRLRLSEDRGEGTEAGKPWDGGEVPAEFGIRGLASGGPTGRELGATGGGPRGRQAVGRGRGAGRVRHQGPRVGRPDGPGARADRVDPHGGARLPQDRREVGGRRQDGRL